MATTNWKAVLERQNKASYRWPEGWDTRETVAEQIGCSPDRVTQMLGPGIRAGEIETQQFPVWDDLIKRVVRVTGFRQKKRREELVPKKFAITTEAQPDLEEVVQKIVARHPKASVREIQKLLPRRFRGAASQEDIRAILS